MSIVKKITACAAAAAMAVSFASCSDTSWVYKTGNSALSSGVYISMMAYSYMDAVSQLSADSSNTAKTVWDQKIGDKDAETYIKDSAKDAAAEYLAISDKFKEFKLELSDDDKKSADTAVDSMWNYFQSYVDLAESGCSKESFKENYLSSARQMKIFDHYYGKGGIEEVKDAELKKYYYKNYRAAKLLALSLTDESGSQLSDADVKKLKKQAKNYQSRVDKGESMDKIIKEYAKSVSGDSSDGNAASGSDNVTIIAKSNAEDLFKKIKDLKKGKSFYLVDTASGYIYVGTAEDIKAYEDKYQSSRNNVLAAYKNNDFTKLMDEWTKAIKVTANNSSVKRYSPKKLVINGGR